MASGWAKCTLFEISALKHSFSSLLGLLQLHYAGSSSEFSTSHDSDEGLPEA
jgi:hypothetical protein